MGRSWKRLVEVLGRSWDDLGRSLSGLGGSWGRLGRQERKRGSKWGGDRNFFSILRLLLGGSWRPLEAKMERRDKKKEKKEKKEEKVKMSIRTRKTRARLHVWLVKSALKVRSGPPKSRSRLVQSQVKVKARSRSGQGHWIAGPPGTPGPG